MATAWLAAGLVLALAASVRAQLTTQDEERLQILSDPDAIKKKLEKKKNGPRSSSSSRRSPRSTCFPL